MPSRPQCLGHCCILSHIACHVIEPTMRNNDCGRRSLERYWIQGHVDRGIDR